MRISDWSSDVCSSDLDRRVVDVHRRHLAVAGLGGGDALADLLEGRRGALHVVLGTHRGAQQRALTLVGLVNLAFELLHEGKVDGSAQRTSPLKGDWD